MYRTRLIAVIAVLVAKAAFAQVSPGSVAVSAGTATDLSGVRSNALTFAPSYTTSTALQSATFGATGSWFQNHVWSAGANLGLSSRLSESAIAPTFDLGASAGTSSYSFSYALADVTPALEAHIGSLRLFGGAHLSAGGTSRRLTLQQPLPGNFAPSQTEGSSTTAAAALAGATITLPSSDGTSLSFGLRSERGCVANALETDNTLTATTSSANVALSASLGQRQVENQASSSFGSAMLVLGLTPDAALQVAGGRYPANRMLNTAAGQFFNVGAVLRFGGAEPALPRPSGVERPAVGMTRLSIRAADATTVEVAGEFNQWSFVPAHRAPNGVWYADLRIPSGQYRYAFRIDGKEWRIPEGAAAAEDEFGGKSAWLTVPASGAAKSGQ